MATAEEYAAWIVKNADKKGTPDFETVAKAYRAARAQTPEAKPDPSGVQTAIDTQNAYGTGGNRGLLRLAGLPVDTLANVLDLGKAAIGAPYMAITGKPAPSWLELTDRSKVIGSGENLISGTRAIGAGPMVDPSNPDYEGGYAQMLGGATTGIFNPSSKRELANQVALNVLGGTGAKAVKDATGNEAAAVTASMLPIGLQHASTIGVKAAVRGGEAGRLEMAQRIKDLQAAGVDNPTLGLASGNKLIGGVENLLQSTPGAVGIMQRNRDTAISGLEASAGQAADLASVNRGALESGRSIQGGVKAAKEDYKAKQAELYDKLGQLIGNQSPVEIPNTQATLATLNADIPTMPTLSKQFKNSRIVSIEDALKRDMAEKGTPRYNYTNIVDGRPITWQTPEGADFVPERTAIPFEAVKKTRTLVGNEIADNSLMSDVPRSKWNPLYGALSEDIRAAAAEGGATNAFNRANDYTRSSIGRLERVAPVVDRPSPEQTYTALAASLKENTSLFQAVKKTLPTDARGDFAGTVIERLGRATPGQQDASGAKWSPETFLTNWSRIKPQARAELLSGIPNAAEVSALVDSVAKATAMMRENSKMWANPSGTATNAAARGILGAVGVGGMGAAAGLLNPAIPAAALGGIGGANLLARGVTSPFVRDAMLRPSTMDPELLNSQLRSLIGSGLLDQRQ